MVNGLHLYCAILTTGHSNCFRVSPHIHPFIHTSTHRRRSQPCKATASSSGQSGRVSCSGTPRHQRPSGYHPTCPPPEPLAAHLRPPPAPRALCGRSPPPRCPGGAQGVTAPGSLQSRERISPKINKLTIKDNLTLAEIFGLLLLCVVEP